MISTPFDIAPEYDDNNPLDIVEEIAQEHGWTFTRTDEDLIIVNAQGLKTKYEICMEWQDEFSAVLFACSLPIEFSDAQYEIVAQTMEQINQNLWMGHFDLSNKGKFPTFRHTLLFRMVPSGIAGDIIHDVMDIAIAECNRFYTTLQLAQAGDVRMQDNLDAAVFETIGEA